MNPGIVPAIGPLSAHSNQGGVMTASSSRHSEPGSK